MLTKTVQNFSCSVTVLLKVGFPMRLSDSAGGGDAAQVAKLEVENRALAAEGGLSP